MLLKQEWYHANKMAFLAWTLHNSIASSRFVISNPDNKSFVKQSALSLPLVVNTAIQAQGGSNA
ncbi:hypothetical protein GKE73_02260 [Paludibacterium sp. dN 18-1]|uniref:Uncharacterized protein n=1 Tax=Paludibacterium denitrificans TaxID=2675226 RepID=A0A844G862_9NEIS|nr:hypothetical protein [Paludibacterium denitrificans]